MRLPPPLRAKLEALAVQRGRPKSELVREPIERLVDKEKVQVSVYDLVKDLVGPGRGPEDLSTNPKHMKGYGE